MEPINNFQVGNYVQYQSQIMNNGQIAMIVDRISSIDDKQIKTQKGLTIAIELAKSQFFPISIKPEWLQAIGFEKHCEEGTFSIWTLSKILCKWKQDSVVSLFLYLNSVFKHKHKLIHNQAPV